MINVENSLFIFVPFSFWIKNKNTDRFALLKHSCQKNKKKNKQKKHNKLDKKCLH